MRAVRCSDYAVNAKADATTDLLNGGYLAIFSGTKPDSADEEPGEDCNLLAVLQFGVCAFKSARAGVAEAEPIEADPSSRAGGKPSWFRAYTMTNEAVFDGTVGPDGDGEAYDMTLDCDEIAADTEVRLETLQYREQKQ